LTRVPCYWQCQSHVAYVSEKRQ